MNLGWLAPGLRLASPWALVLLAALPFWLIAVRRRQRGGGGLRFPHAGQLYGLPRSWRVRTAPLGDVLRLTVLISLCVALARPQMGFQRDKVKQKGVDILLALDVSGSMRAEDVGTNRLEAAKQTILNFLTRLDTDRVGLVVFAGRSFTQCPLTTDYGMIAQLLDECHIGMVPFDGTAIGDALANCLYRFQSDAERREGKSLKASGRSRVVILLTDGFNNTGRVQPGDAAVMAKVKGVRVHAVGLGTLEGAPVPVTQFGQRAYLQNEDGTLLIASLDERSLRTIADITGGQYFRATDAAALDRIYQKIATMEKHDIEIEHVVDHEERFLAPLLTALLLLTAELLLRATVWRVVL
ncbi:MAG: VWA domain-containing protein [Armatimonadetes bacterium]|nr:VWA domain-containing protein [Armatimonadota bacterium]